MPGAFMLFTHKMLELCGLQYTGIATLMVFIAGDFSDLLAG